jgi:hypothetical protein
MPQLREPTQCHLWKLNHPELGRDAKDDKMELVKEFERDSHLIRSLLRCSDCGQFYFYEFYEEIDWSGENDPLYRTWIPIDEKDIDDLLKVNIWTIHDYTPRIINDWLRDGTIETNGFAGMGQIINPYRKSYRSPSQLESRSSRSAISSECYLHPSAPRRSGRMSSLYT